MWAAYFAQIGLFVEAAGRAAVADGQALAARFERMDARPQMMKSAASPCMCALRRAAVDDAAYR